MNPPTKHTVVETQEGRFAVYDPSGALLCELHSEVLARACAEDLDGEKAREAFPVGRFTDHSLHALFERCVRRESGDGWSGIHCQLGLWGVEGPSKSFVESEAMRYWIQYYQDGEYRKLLAVEAA